METVLLIIHVLAAAGIVALVLLQQGKGADMGAAFGAGASATVFGSQGSGNFLTRGTAILATVFFLTSISLAALSGHGASSATKDSLMSAPAAVESGAEDVPAAPDSAPAASDVPSAPEGSEGVAQ